MRSFVLPTIVFGMLFVHLPPALAQPFLPGHGMDDERQTEPEDEQLRRELMRQQGERMLAEREEINRSHKMMRYALVIALLVVGTTLLIAFARSRVAEDSKPPARPPSPPPPARPPSPPPSA